MNSIVKIIIVNIIGLVMQVLWIIFFSHLRQAKIILNQLKYQDVNSFLLAYNGKFDDYSLEDQRNLTDTANWMIEMFKYLPARKNKGLAIQMVPKLIEGWKAKYVTGSGQTKATADRVFIFETEGGVTPAHRGSRVSAFKKATLSTDKQQGEKQQGKRPISKMDANGAKIKRPRKIGFFGQNGNNSNNSQNEFNNQYDMTQVNELSRRNSSGLDNDLDDDNSDAMGVIVGLNIEGLNQSNEEANEYLEIFRGSNMLPSTSASGAVIVPGAVVPAAGLGTTLAMGPFQPLFDFSLLGPAPVPLAVGLANQPQLDKDGNLLLTLPPLLKRAYSWEDGNNGNGNDGEDNVSEKVKESVAVIPAPATFLFNEYLISHP